jgi:hypothetical protein
MGNQALNSGGLDNMANALYDFGRAAFLNGQIGWNNNTIKCSLLSNAYTPTVATEEHMSQVDAYTFTGTTDQTIGTKTIAAGVADGADITFTAVGASGSYNVKYLCIYESTGTNTNSHLIALIDTATGLPVTPNGGSITVTWDNGANKIFKL